MRIPKYRKHTAGHGTPQAMVEWRGKRYYLGRYGSTDSHKAYREFLDNNVLPAAEGPVIGGSPSPSFTISTLVSAFLDHAIQYYPRKEYEHLKRVAKALLDSAGSLRVQDFTPRAIKALRSDLVARGLSRAYVNQAINRTRRIFRWGVAEEIVSATTLHALDAVPGLAKGRTTAIEAEPVRPAPAGSVAAVLAVVSRPHADMIEVQQSTGMRSGELCIMRPKDIDRSGAIWLYRPPIHKTAHRGKERVIHIGPKAQGILLPYLARRLPGQFVFSPRENREIQYAARRAARKSKVAPSQAGRRAKRKPMRKPGDRYTSHSYCNIVRRACVIAEERAHKLHPEIDPKQQIIEPWTPHQLRHSFGTFVRGKYGLEAAQVALGHSRADVTEIYAERDLSLARRVASEIG